jgi:hypothetical protein
VERDEGLKIRLGTRGSQGTGDEHDGHRVGREENFWLARSLERRISQGGGTTSSSYWE